MSASGFTTMRPRAFPNARAARIVKPTSDESD